VAERHTASSCLTSDAAAFVRWHGRPYAPTRALCLRLLSLLCDQLLWNCLYFWAYPITPFRRAFESAFSAVGYTTVATEKHESMEGVGDAEGVDGGGGEGPEVSLGGG
jgi:hypothetical protein